MFAFVLTHEPLEGPQNLTSSPRPVAGLQLPRACYLGTICVALSNNDVSLHLCLLTWSPSFSGRWKVYQSKRKHQWLFLPLLSWLSMYWHLVYTHFNKLFSVCLARQFLALCRRLFFFKGRIIVKLTWWLVNKACTQCWVPLPRIFLWNKDYKFISKMPGTVHLGHYYLPSALFQVISHSVYLS